ncbi:MAG: elongation factor Ts [Dehalococcoidales bacterium]|nr:MAG: elongation factor Ts [Dehalococcoidales bacterium]
MDISTERVKELRELSGAGIMDCRNALLQTKGDKEKALQILKEQNLVRVEKKSTRAASQGLVETYVHTGGRIGAMVELNCETDFVARTTEFQELAHNLAMQIAAQEPICISEDQIPKDTDTDPELACLLLQPFIKDPQQTIQDLITETAAKVRENIRVSRFARFELGQAAARVAELEKESTAHTDA